MKCCAYVLLLLCFNTASGTFWKNDDFERIVGSYAKSISPDYLRALSIFKRKLQLLGFYPIVLNDDGLEYVSMEPFLIEDDNDDQMYKLLKEMKKEKKARKKALKKKLKKAKKTKTEEKPVSTTPTASTTAVQPTSNIVYYWPSTITAIVHPGQSKGTSTDQQSFDTRIDISESSEEKSSELESNFSDQINSSDENKSPKINSATSFSFERKFKYDDGDTRAIENQTSTTTTTPYPLITVFADPEDLEIQEILDQQEIVNKIADSKQNDQRNDTKTVPNDLKTIDESLNVQDDLSEADQSIKVPIQDVVESPTYSAEFTKNEDHVSEINVPTNNPDPTASTDVIESEATEISAVIPAGALQFFHETLPDESLHRTNSVIPWLSEIFTNVPISTSTDAYISDQIAEIKENDQNTDGHRETGTQSNYSVVKLLNDETSTLQQMIDEHSTTTPRTTDDNIDSHVEITHPNAQKANDEDAAERYPNLIDPKITLESRSLLPDEPVLAAVVTGDKSGRRSDVPIETDEVNEERKNDDLAYIPTGENLLERASNDVENTSAEMLTEPTPPAPVSLADQFDGEVIPLIPIIIKQMKQGNVSPEEMEIMKNTFGPFWPYIVEEASRESESSEEMNPLLSEVLSSINRKIVKREATPTLGRRRRPIYRRRRVYYDDDFVPSRTYYERRGRPIVEYY